ncbi:monovalent cation/H(+) antiporter subunit G [Streptomyces sp. NPDC051322]|uniref:monovalent cation/H(+) antiporter subunit G n=1 Tax=Streptomyces sp. NPDC051322 TaxID=3154645 RepID=UPI00344FE425
MSGLVHGVMLAFYAAGTVVVIWSVLAALTVRRAYNRLHFVTPATSLGAPLIGVALGIENGWGLTTALDELIIVLLAITGPVLESATGRVAAQRDGLVPEDAPS